jgi:pimeloyl-ACP methyl ester carboxylesterase
MRKFYLIMSFIFLIISSNFSFAQEAITIKSTDGNVSTTQLGEGDHILILIHGRSGNSLSWFKKEYENFGQEAVKQGFKVISVNWSGQPGASANKEIDIVVSSLTNNPNQKISLAGFSAGGQAVANYTRSKNDGFIHSLLQINSIDDKPITQTNTIKVFLYNLRDRDSGIWQKRAADATPEPKIIHQLAGSGHWIPDLIREDSQILSKALTSLK